MTTQEKIDHLKRARARLAEPGRWGQFHYASDAMGDSVNPRSPRAQCWCVQGALRLESTGSDWDPANHELRVTLAIEKPDYHHHIPTWNDTHGRTQADVIGLFDRTIARLEASL